MAGSFVVSSSNQETNATTNAVNEGDGKNSANLQHALSMAMAKDFSDKNTANTDRREVEALIKAKKRVFNIDDYFLYGEVRFD